jgi:hypothetical protein
MILAMCFANQALSDTAVFQQGASGYNGTVDTFLKQATPASSFGGSSIVEWDGSDGGGQNFGLLRFDNIFGSGPGQIPAGSLITSATLTYNVGNPGNAATVNEVVVDWDESVTYNTFGGDVGVQVDEYGTEVGSAAGGAGENTLDVTGSIVTWLDNPSANKGWIFRPTGGTDGVEFASSENTNSSQRPKLTVDHVVVTKVEIIPDQIDAVAGSADTEVLVAIPLGSNDSTDVNVTLTTNNASVAVPVGATGNSLVVTFPMGGSNTQNVSIDIGNAGTTTIDSTNDAGLGDDTLTVNVGAGAILFATDDIVAIESSNLPVDVTITEGSNDTRTVLVTVTTDNQNVAVPEGATAGSLILTFSAGGSNVQSVNMQFGVSGDSTITTTNNGGLSNDSFSVHVTTGFNFTVTADPRSSTANWNSVLSGMQDNCGGMGAFHVTAGDLDPPQPLRDAIDTHFPSSPLWYPIIGNHEIDNPGSGNPDIQWVRDEYNTGHGVRTPLKNSTNQDGPAGCIETTYSWDYGNARFISLNEYWNGGTAPGSDEAISGNIIQELYDWLAANLAANTQPVIFVFGHEPAYPFYRHVGDSLDQYPTNRDNFWNLLESENVQTYFCGHTHFYSKYRPNPDKTWQVDAGNAGNWSSPGDTPCFINVTVTAGAIRYDVWKADKLDNITGFALLETWTEMLGLNINLSTHIIERTVYRGDNLTKDTFTVSAFGAPGTINYTIGDNVGWLDIDPTSGSSAGEPDPIDVIYSVSGLPVGQHSGTITVSSGDAGNSPQTIIVTVTVETVSPDFDGDADVDQEDFGHLQKCLSGEGTPQTDPNCLDARLDADTDVDLDDFNILQGCMSGPNTPANSTCDD